MQELIVNNKPAVVEVNFEELRESLERDLEKYRVVVTAETVKDAKTLATELRKTKKVIADRRKAEVAKASEPVKAFDEQMKQLEKMIDAGVDDLKVQVDRFEDETREQVREKLTALRSELWSDFAVEQEFQRAELDDLVIVSNLTQKGNLTAKARDDIKARVQADKGLQDQTRLRLAELESESYRAGLAAPLSRDHVEHFLFADDERYRSELDRILEAEVRRQEQAEQRERDRIERQRVAEERAERERQERQEREEAERLRRESIQREKDNEAELARAGAHVREELLRRQDQAAGNGRENQEGEAEVPRNLEELEAKQPSENTRPADDARKVSVTVECLFDIDVPVQVTDEQIEGQLRAQMAEAGFQSKPRIRVLRNAQ